MLHDAGRTFRAQYAAIDRMRRVAFDVADFAIFNMDIDPAAASAHITGRLFDLVADRLVEFELGFGHAAYCEANAEKTREENVPWERRKPRINTFAALFAAYAACVCNMYYC